MTAIASTSTAPARAAGTAGARLNFLRILRSEWIKFVTVRSTVWVVLATLVVMVGFSTLMAVGMVSMAEAGAEAGGPPPEAGMATEGSAVGVMVATFGYGLGQIVVAVLGVLVITGEYSTGQIKSSLAAVPTRLPVLWAKGIIVGATAFVVGGLAVFVSALLTTPILKPHDMAVDFGAEGTLESLLSVPLYLTAVTLFAYGLGALLRHSAAGIATAIGVLLVLPILGQIGLDWIQNIATYLPSTAGERLIQGDFPEADLTPWQGFGVLGIWVAVVLAAAAILLRRRDA